MQTLARATVRSWWRLDTKVTLEPLLCLRILLLDLGQQRADLCQRVARSSASKVLHALAARLNFAQSERGRRSLEKVAEFREPVEVLLSPARVKFRPR